MTNVVLVLLVELVVGDELEGLSPEYHGFLDRESDSLERSAGLAVVIARSYTAEQEQTLRNRLYC